MKMFYNHVWIDLVQCNISTFQRKWKQTMDLCLFPFLFLPLDVWASLSRRLNVQSFSLEGRSHSLLKVWMFSLSLQGFACFVISWMVQYSACTRRMWKLEAPSALTPRMDFTLKCAAVHLVKWHFGIIILVFIMTSIFVCINICVKGLFNGPCFTPPPRSLKSAW